MLKPHSQRHALLFVLFCLLALLGACAKPSPQSTYVPNSIVPNSQALATWQGYERYSHIMESDHGPYRISASLRYQSGTKGHRLVAYMWANDAGPHDSLRLDIMAGIGATVAQVQEDANTFLLYSPNEKKAYYHRGSRKPLFSLGVPVPFSIGDMSALMLGRFTKVFGTHKKDQAILESNDRIAYTLARAQDTYGSAHNELLSMAPHAQGRLILSSDGLVRQWIEAGDPEKQGWTLDITYADALETMPLGSITLNAAMLPLPRKLTFNYRGPKGIEHTAILLIKDRERPKPFAPEQITLQIPTGIPLLPIRDALR